MWQSGVEKVGAVVSAALGSAQERQAAHLLAAGALGAAALADDPSRKLRIRWVVRPDRAQALLLDRLGLRRPERLRPPPSIPDSSIAQM
jgi:hypothetical protein